MHILFMFMFVILLLLIPSCVGFFACSSYPGSYLLSNSHIQYSDFFAYKSSVSSHHSTPLHASLSTVKSKPLSHSSSYDSSTPYLTVLQTSLSIVKSKPMSLVSSYASSYASSTPYLTVLQTSLSTIKSKPWEYIPSTSTNPHTMFDSSTPYLTVLHTSVSTIKSKPWIYISSSSHYFNPYLNPSVNPSQNPSQNQLHCPSVNPSQCPSVTPSQTTIIPILSFESAVSLSGLSEPSLDTPAQTAVTVAVANSANVSAQFVIFLKQHQISQAQTHIFVLNSKKYTIEATTQLNIPLYGFYATVPPETLYSSISNNLENSVETGIFNTFLFAASIAVNSTSTQNALSTDVVVKPMAILSPSAEPSYAPNRKPNRRPYPKPSKNPSLPLSLPSSSPSNTSHSQEKSQSVVLIIIISFALLSTIIYFYVKRREQNHIILEIEDI